MDYLGSYFVVIVDRVLWTLIKKLFLFNMKEKCAYYTLVYFLHFVTIRFKLSMRFKRTPPIKSISHFYAQVREFYDHGYRTQMEISLSSFLWLQSLISFLRIFCSGKKVRWIENDFKRIVLSFWKHSVRSSANKMLINFYFQDITYFCNLPSSKFSLSSVGGTSYRLSLGHHITRISEE